MSAESPRKSYRSGGSTVRPQPATDKTVIESVVDFIQDVVPAYGNTAQKTDDREKIHWVQFQQADINSIHTNPDYDVQSGIVPPLLLLIGYTNGVQIWAIPVSGEAQEVMSVRQGPVRFLKVMPTPLTVPGCPDLFACKRPLLAVCDASSAGQPYCNVKFLSLRTGDEVHNITFKLPVTDIQCNQRVVVVAFAEKIAAFDAFDLREKFCVTSCYPCPGPNPNPIALGTRWLAYADKKLVPVHQSCGGMTGDGRQSYAATVISAAKTITKGLTIFGETVASSLTGMKSFPTPAQKEAVDNEGCRPGVVTIIDIENAGKGQVSDISSSLASIYLKR
ncbi:Breast carcinoma-amplified sequence 3 [Lamellibrachia satsuma]|nr:Breast carcinoma-amplified sequence 3 [Lamellibrachia satsuma]